METLGEVAVPRSARTFVRVFLVAFVVAGLLGIEAWPLTGFRLFATVRTDRQEALRAVLVSPHGDESRLPFGKLPPAYRGSVQVLQGLEALPPIERAEVCRAWTDALADMGIEAARIRVYREWWLLSVRREDRATGPVGGGGRQLVHDCGETRS